MACVCVYVCMYVCVNVPVALGICAHGAAVKLATGCLDTQNTTIASVGDVEMMTYVIYYHVSGNTFSAAQWHIKISTDVSAPMVNDACAMKLIHVKAHEVTTQPVHVPDNVARNSGTVPAVNGIALWSGEIRG